MNRTLALAWLAACSGGPSETGDTGPGFGDGPTGLWPVPSLPECSAPFGPNCVDHAVWSDACAGDPAPISRDDLVYEGPLGEDGQPTVQVVTESSVWTALLGSNTAERTVDFGAEQVVVLRWDISSTCGARLTQNGVGADGTVRMALEDPSGACEAVCDMYGMYGVAYAIPASATPVACVAIVNSCQP